jgi:hypothetical protein
MPRVILRDSELSRIQQEIKKRKGVEFNTTNQEAVFSMLKYWCREAAKGHADVESVVKREERFLVVGNDDFFAALRSIL